MAMPYTEANGASTRQIVLATYDRYQDAEKAVDFLSDNGFPVERTAIAGRGLSMVEQVTGRLTIWRAAGQGALSGGVIGVLLGWILGLFNWVDPLVSMLLIALYGLVVGAIMGGVIGLVGHALTGGRRDFSVIAGMRADYYQILVEAEVADEALRMLEEANLAGRV